jgi:hypothetical protein
MLSGMQAGMADLLEKVLIVARPVATKGRA